MERGFLIILFLASMILPVSPAVANVFLLIFGGGIVIENSVKRNFPPKKEWFKLLILPSFFFFWMLIGTLFSPYKKEGFHLVEIAIPFMVLSLAYIFASESLKEKAQNIIPSGLMVGVGGSLIYLIVSLVIRFMGSEEDSILGIFSYRFSNFNFINPIGTHPTYYSVWILVANYFAFNSKVLKKPIKLFLLALFFIGLVFTMSRVGLFLYILQILAVFFYLSKKGKIIYGGGLILFLLIGIYLYKNQLSNLYILQRISIELAWDVNPDNTGTEVNNRVPDDSRTARWSAILETIKEKPIFGFGVGSERTILDKTYKDHALEVSLEREYNAHNQYLLYMVEQGVVGLILFLFYFCFNLGLAIKRRDLFTLFFILGIMTVFVFENYMYRSMGYLTIALFLTFMKKSKK